MLGLRKIVHHYPLDTDKIILSLTEPLFYKTLVRVVGSPVHGEYYSGFFPVLLGAGHCGKYISSLYSSTPKIIIFVLHNSAFVCGNQVSEYVMVFNESFHYSDEQWLGQLKICLMTHNCLP